MMTTKTKRELKDFINSLDKNHMTTDHYFTKLYNFIGGDIESQKSWLNKIINKNQKGTITSEKKNFTEFCNGIETGDTQLSKNVVQETRAIRDLFDQKLNKDKPERTLDNLDDISVIHLNNIKGKQEILNSYLESNQEKPSSKFLSYSKIAIGAAAATSLVVIPFSVPVITTIAVGSLYTALVGIRDVINNSQINTLNKKEKKQITPRLSNAFSDNLSIANKNIKNTVAPNNTVKSNNKNTVSPTVNKTVNNTQNQNQIDYGQSKKDLNEAERNRNIQKANLNSQFAALKKSRNNV